MKLIFSIIVVKSVIKLMKIIKVTTKEKFKARCSEELLDALTDASTMEFYFVRQLS